MTDAKLEALRLEMSLKSRARVHAWIARLCMLTIVSCFAYVYSLITL